MHLKKKVAYATSIAIPEILKDKEQFFKDSLNEMKAILMREKVSAELVKILIGREVSVVVVDLTTLLYIGIMYKFFMNIEGKSKIKRLIFKFK